MPYPRVNSKALRVSALLLTFTALRLPLLVPLMHTSQLQGGPILTPQDMLEALSSTPNSIGYLPTSIGTASGLAEARLVVGGTPYLSRDLPPTAAITQVGFQGVG